MDHLEGILFVDHISALKRNMILRQMKKQATEDWLRCHDNRQHALASRLHGQPWLR